MFDCFLKNFSQRYVEMMSSKTGAQITGSWTVDIGEQDEASASHSVSTMMYPKGAIKILNTCDNIYLRWFIFKPLALHWNYLLWIKKTA